MDGEAKVIQQQPAGSDQVIGRLNYLLRTSEKPYSYTFSPPPPGKPQRSGQYQSLALPIRDGRRVVGQLSLDRQGFALVPHATAVQDLYDDAEVRATYYPEMEALVQRVTGADKVVVFDHTWRSNAPGRRGEAGIREPVLRAHNDYTVKSGPQRVRDLLEPAEAEQRLKHRFAIINVWRPIRGPLTEAPLALCDAGSMAAGDFIASDLIYRDRIGETYAVAHNPEHRWFYFPAMQRDETVLIKCYDSAADRARFTAHTAFEDPTAPANPLPRESIEIRTLVFFPPDPGAGSPNQR